MPAVGANTLDRMVLGNCFTASLIRTAFLQPDASDISKALKDIKKRMNWLVF